MAKLKIQTTKSRVEVCGEFCDWKIENSITATKAKGGKFITIDEMPEGEYRVFSEKDFASGEIYPTDKRQMANRYFSGEANEVICSYFYQ